MELARLFMITFMQVLACCDEHCNLSILMTRGLRLLVCTFADSSASICSAGVYPMDPTVTKEFVTRNVRRVSFLRMNATHTVGSCVYGRMLACPQMRVQTHTCACTRARSIHAHSLGTRTFTEWRMLAREYMDRRI
eukprot:6189328-Pleurochrysis_carterae.AAC.1